MNDMEFFNIAVLEWVGYVASVLVLVSLSLSSILRLRVFNLLGAAVFSFYGFAIGSLPVGIMNFIIVLTNLYYLRKLYALKDEFEIIEAKISDVYVQRFLSFYNKDIRTYFPEFDNDKLGNRNVIMVMRNMNLAGLMIVHADENVLNIDLDYVTPQYRDYKNGQFIFDHFKTVLRGNAGKTIIAKTKVAQQIKYLKKMGFEQTPENSEQYQLSL